MQLFRHQSHCLSEAYIDSSAATTDLPIQFKHVLFKIFMVFLMTSPLRLIGNKEGAVEVKVHTLYRTADKLLKNRMSMALSLLRRVSCVYVQQIKRLLPTGAAVRTQHTVAGE